MEARGLSIGIITVEVDILHSTCIVFMTCIFRRSGNKGGSDGRGEAEVERLNRRNTQRRIE